MRSDAECPGEGRLHHLQEALEEGLRAIFLARSTAESEAARRRAQLRLAELNHPGTGALPAKAAG